jgi:acyl-CoA synthetase (AMP-forming)/AMP-acid ligase II
MFFPALGTQLFVVQKFEFLQFLKYLEKYEVTSISGVPPIMIALAKHPAVAKFNLSHIRTLGSGAAPLGKDIAREVEGMFQKKYGTQIRIRQGWGMTE